MISLIRKQIWNERKSNVNLFIELLLFSVLTWYIVDFIYIHMLAHFSPKGFDTTNCYTVGVDVLPEESEDYSPDASKTMNNDLFKIVDRLKQIPEVDAVCLSYRSAHPYGNSWRQDDFECVTDTMIHYGKYDIQTVSSDFFNVFRYRGSNGETPDMMAKQFESMSIGDIFTTDNIRKSNHAD
ncbi:MAG: ABC transporter permease, partial [Tannerellaceae bacterium]